MNKNEKPYRVSISFPPEIADIIRAYAEEDERTFTWEVVRMLKDLFEERENGYRPIYGSPQRDAQDKHQRIVKQLQEEKEEVQA